MNQNTNILIVDDDENLRYSLSLILRKGEYSVTSAANAGEAFRVLKSKSFEIMFLDLNIPDMNGMEILVETRKLYPDISVLIFTAHATLDTAIRAVRQGARDYILKPIEPDYILNRVREILDEIQQPVRKKEIFTEIQSLLSELQEIEGPNAAITPNPLLTLSPTAPSRFLQKGPFSLDLHARHAVLNEKYVDLTGTNFDYLTTLLRHAPKAVPYLTLVKESQGFEVTAIEARTLARWRMHEIRKVIELNPDHPRLILTVRGVGYRLNI